MPVSVGTSLGGHINGIMNPVSLVRQNPTRCYVNPFSSNQVRPGVIAYIFPNKRIEQRLLQQFRRWRGWGQIVGPHGSGKSTLVHWLAGQMEGMSRRAIVVSLQGSQHAHSISRLELDRWDSGSQLFLDGYERLPWWRQRWLEKQCRHRCIGLVVTTHRTFDFPTLFRTCVTPAIAQGIVRQLLARQLRGESLTSCPFVVTAGSLMSLGGTTELLAKHHGNMREMLFTLYDHFEQIRQREEISPDSR